MTRLRSAFSLLEVIIATGILAASSVLVLSLLSTGQRLQTRGQDQIEAQIICQTLLDELVALPAHLEPAEQEPVPGDPDWHYSIDWTPTRYPDLAQVRVQVFRAPTEALTPSDELESLEPPRPTYELVRWLAYDASQLDDGDTFPSPATSPETLW